MHIKYFLSLCIGLILLSCNENKTSLEVENTKTTEVNFAKGFTISSNENLTIITITNPWPEAKKSFRYALVKDEASVKSLEGKYDAVVKVPLTDIVVTSTTHIPSLEMLGVEKSLVGFPSLNYISSQKTRKHISEGKIKELGKNESINTEMLIELNPQAVIGFGIDGNNPTFNTIEKLGTPVLYNADWTEKHPLGKAEWIKFFGALYGKQKEADSIFSEIERNYNEAQKIAKTATTSPTILSGAMYKDVWYMPQGDSWAAQFIADANGDYLWKDSEGTGSIALNLESVLEKGQNAQIWISPGQFKSTEQLAEMHHMYTQFDAFKNDKVYNFTNKTGATGGVIYYELAPNRPDIVLKDIIKILHPELLPEHELYFFSKI
ncbi:putative iron-related ABC transport periplasmic binding protein [unidentified eubacterium SCB49]|nr:putative iron-related ABC transport periplasmic binding protein [unidentified eubacterium SCB49]